jgi:hypothetical protein
MAPGLGLWRSRGLSSTTFLLLRGYLPNRKAEKNSPLENVLWRQFVFLLDQYDETKGGTQSFVANLLRLCFLDRPGQEKMRF